MSSWCSCRAGQVCKRPAAPSLGCCSPELPTASATSCWAEIRDPACHESVTSTSSLLSVASLTSRLSKAATAMTAASPKYLYSASMPLVLLVPVLRPAWCWNFGWFDHLAAAVVVAAVAAASVNNNFGQIMVCMTVNFAVLQYSKNNTEATKGFCMTNQEKIMLGGDKSWKYY